MKYKNIELPDDMRTMTFQFITGIIDTFDDENKLNKLDELSLYLLAGNVDMFLECEEHIKNEGMVQISDRGNSSLSPYVIHQKSVSNSILSLLKEFGLTLGSRSKLKVIDVEENNPLLDFLKK